MGTIRERATEILDGIPKLDITSDGKTASDYTKYTGLTHATMAANWKTGGIMTGCNGFVGWYGTQLGSDKYLGRFDLDTYLPKNGKGHAWVRSTSDRRPQYGDILRHTAFHVDVCLGFDDDVLLRIAAGQGGKSAGHDILRRVRGKSAYDPKSLQGWVDIDLYFGAAPAATPLPDWLPGWWKVTWRGQDYYYFFDAKRTAKWIPFAPTNTSQPPVFAKDTGNVTVEHLGVVSIRWGATGSVERFVKAPVTAAQMGGTWNDTEPISALKM